MSLEAGRHQRSALMPLAARFPGKVRSHAIGQGIRGRGHRHRGWLCPIGARDDLGIHVGRYRPHGSRPGPAGDQHVRPRAADFETLGRETIPELAATRPQEDEAVAIESFCQGRQSVGQGDRDRDRLEAFVGVCRHRRIDGRREDTDHQGLSRGKGLSRAGTVALEATQLATTPADLEQDRDSDPEHQEERPEHGGPGQESLGDPRQPRSRCTLMTSLSVSIRLMTRASCETELTWMVAVTTAVWSAVTPTWAATMLTLFSATT